MGAIKLAGTFGLFLIIRSAPDIWQWTRGRIQLSAVKPPGALLIVLGTLSLPLWTPIVGLFQDFLNITLVNPDPNDPGIVTGEVVRATVETGAPAGGGLYIAAFLVAVLVVLSVAIGLAWDKRRWPWMAIVFVGITLPLFTTFFTSLLTDLNTSLLTTLFTDEDSFLHTFLNAFFKYFLVP